MDPRDSVIMLFEWSVSLYNFFFLKGVSKHFGGFREQGAEEKLLGGFQEARS